MARPPERPSVGSGPPALRLFFGGVLFPDLLRGLFRWHPGGKKNNSALLRAVVKEPLDIQTGVD